MKFNFLKNNGRKTQKKVNFGGKYEKTQFKCFKFIEKFYKKCFKLQYQFFLSIG